MHIKKYIPQKMYGFAEDETGLQVFFHLGVFKPGDSWVILPDCKSCPVSDCTWAKTAPPPISGEIVDVQVDLDSPKSKAPRASKIIRLHEQKPIQGRIHSFDNQRGYGFFESLDGSAHYYVHKSDIIGNRIPIINQIGVFYLGERDSKTRACHVRLCS